jgi:hypothetical protein
LRVLWACPGCRKRVLRHRLLLWMAAPIIASGQILPPRTPAPDSALQISSSSSLPDNSDRDDAKRDAKRDLVSCRIHEVTGLPGSDHFASHFIETMASDPKDPGVLWGLTADLSDRVPASDRAMYILKSTNGGASWTQVARVGSRYFDADIAEGLRNGLAVSPGGTEFVITTQEGAFQVIPQSDISAPQVSPIAGPRVPHPRPPLSIPKNEGDPVRAGVVTMTADGKHLIIGYGYFDLNPQILTYHRNDRRVWIEDGPLLHLPTDLDIFSMQFDNPKRPHPGSLYVGTGDQAYRLDLRTKRWTRIAGVGPDSAIHGMTTVGGLHLAACWGVYEPLSADAVARVTHARFLLHRTRDEVGPNIRAYGIEVDPARHNREILTAITGVYASKDSGSSWRRLNDLPEGEFHSAHFNPDGTVIVSGFVGTFLANPFSNACSPHLKTREK